MVNCEIKCACIAKGFCNLLINCSDVDLDSPVLYINGMAFDETNDNTGILQLEAEDNATSITLNVKLMSIQDQVVSYLTTNATNGNIHT